MGDYGGDEEQNYIGKADSLDENRLRERNQKQ